MASLVEREDELIAEVGTLGGRIGPPARPTLRWTAGAFLLYLTRVGDIDLTDVSAASHALHSIAGELLFIPWRAEWARESEPWTREVYEAHARASAYREIGDTILGGVGMLLRAGRVDEAGAFLPYAEMCFYDYCRTLADACMRCLDIEACADAVLTCP